MIKLIDVTKKIILVMLSLNLIAIFISVFFGYDIQKFIMGILFGFIFSTLKLVLLEKTLNRAIDMKGQRAENHMRLHYIARYFLTFAILIIAALRQDILNLYAVIISMLLLRPAVYIVNLKEKKKKIK